MLGHTLWCLGYHWVLVHAMYSSGDAIIPVQDSAKQNVQKYHHILLYDSPVTVHHANNMEAERPLFGVPQTPKPKPQLPGLGLELR